MKYIIRFLALWLLIVILLTFGAYILLLSLDINLFCYINVNTIGIIIGLVGIPIGAGITFYASRKYYLQSIKDMERQNNASRIVNNTMASFLEITLGNGKTLFHRDNEGNIIGLEIFSSDELKLKFEEQSQKED